MPVAIGGIFQPDWGGPATCWFSVVPGSVDRSLVPVVLLMRQIVRHSVPQFPGGLAAYVRDGNHHGARLAHQLGFVATDVAVGELRRWVHGRIDGKDREKAA